VAPSRLAVTTRLVPTTSMRRGRYEHDRQWHLVRGDGAAGGSARRFNCHRAGRRRRSPSTRTHATAPGVFVRCRRWSSDNGGCRSRARWRCGWATTRRCWPQSPGGCTVGVRACCHTPVQVRLDPQHPGLIERT
jgi:hypothetical protein